MGKKGRNAEICDSIFELWWDMHNYDSLWSKQLAFGIYTEGIRQFKDPVKVFKVMSDRMDRKSENPAFMAGLQ